MAQQDWRRDPIWQLIGTIIATTVALMTQFNDLTSKLVILAACAVVCGWVYFGNEYLKRIFKHPVVVIVLQLLRSLLLLLLCAVLFFLCLVLFFKADNLLEKVAAGAGCILALSTSTTLYHNERSVIAGIFKYTGFMTGIVGIALVFVVDTTWLKIVLGIGAVLVEILTYAFFPDPRGGVRIPRVLQKRQVSDDKS